jgi:L-methionine (R)-S-oxide reductase
MLATTDKPQEDAVTLSPEDQQWLEAFVGSQGGLAGTLHRAHGSDLHLTAALNIPPPVLAAVQVVARGKGMAGLAQVQGRPVQTCNLQDDDSGRIRPMAKLVGGQAAIALPIKTPVGDVRAVVGITFAFAGEIGADVERTLAAAAASLP